MSVHHTLKILIGNGDPKIGSCGTHFNVYPATIVVEYFASLVAMFQVPLKRCNRILIKPTQVRFDFLQYAKINSFGVKYCSADWH